MNTEQSSQLSQALISRRDTIADSWSKAIAQTSFVPLITTELRRQLADLTEQAITLLLAQSFEHGRAEAIGTSLASLHYLEPEAIGRTQEVLAQQLVQGLPADQVVALQPRLAALLGGVAAGFFQQAREVILAGQEQIRRALTTELQQAQEALQKAYQEVEQQVQVRTAELRATNESLQHEITERKQAEEALRESEERYRGLFEGVPVGLYRTTPDGCFLDVNSAMLKMLDYPDKESLLAVTAPDLQLNVIPDEERQRRLALLERHGAIRDLEAQLRRHDGTVIWTQSNFRAVRHAEGRVVGYEGSLEDITERKRAEKALRESEERFRGIFENATIGLYRTTPDGRILMANPALLRMLGYSSFDELAQRDLEEAGYEPEYPRSAFKQRIKSEGQAFGLESAWVRHDGTTLFVRESARAFRDEAGNTLYYEGTVEDITERKRAEEEIKQRNRELSALNAITATVNRSLNLGEVLNRALDKVLEMLELETGAIRLLDERGGTLDLKVHRGLDLSPQMIERISQVKLAEGPLADAIATGKPQNIEDISANPIVELRGRRDLKSLTVIPLRSKGRVLGTIEIMSPDSRQFTSEEIQLLISIGQQIGVAIENARLYKQAQNSANQAASLFEIGQSLTSSLDLDRTLSLIVEEAAKLLETDICSLFLYDHDADELLGQARYGASDEELEGVRVSLSYSQTAAEAKATLKPVVVEDTSLDHRVPAEIVAKWGIKSSITVPLVAEGRFLGVIFLASTKAPRRFTADEIELAQSFASQAAIALENAQLYAHSEELAISKERNRVAREIHDDLSQRLASLLMRVDLCLDLIDGEPEEAKKELDKIGVALQDSIRATRRSIFALRPLALEKLGFRRALCSYIDDFAHQNEISVHLSLPEEGFRLPARMEYMLFRTVQEALNNVRWHAQADTVWIDLGLRSPGRIWLEVRDNGRGFDLGKRVSDMLGDDGRGMGLLHMRERVEAMRGSFHMETEPTVGTKITVTLPLED